MKTKSSVPTTPTSPVESVGPDLLHFLKAAHADLSDTYKAIERFGGPVVSIGQFLRLTEIENAIKAGESSHAAKDAKIRALETALNPFARLPVEEDEHGLTEMIVDTDDVHAARAALALPCAPLGS